MGYFPSYTLGAIMAVQIYNAAKADLGAGALEAQIARGECGALDAGPEMRIPALDDTRSAVFEALRSTLSPECTTRCRIHTVTCFSRTRFGTLREWLREKVHAVGSVHASPDALLTSIAGEPVSPKPFLDYLRAKYSELYRLEE